MAAARAARSTGQIEAEMEATRSRLTGSLETLVDRVHPNRVKQRALQRLREQLRYYADRARDQVVDEHGHPRTTRLALVGGVTVGVVAFWLGIRALAGRSRAS